MKKIALLSIVFASIFAVSAGAQSLADIAAQTRAKQKANPNARIIDNDILPSAPDAASYGSPYETKKDDSSPKSDSAKNDEKKDAEKDKKDQDKKEEAKDKGKDDGKAGAADANQKVPDDLKKKIEDQQKEIAQLQRELDVTQREARLRAAAYYADAGTMLRDQGKFAEDNRKSQADIDSKTQALAAAKQKLDDLQEEARKSGMPARDAEGSQ